MSNLGATETSLRAVTVAVIVVNFRTPELTLECLRSLATDASELPGLRVIVVENGSGDDSLEQLSAGLAAPEFRGWTELAETGANLGFAGGCNHGWRVAPKSDFVLLLNSDARLGPGALQASLLKLMAEPDIGAFSCRLDNEDGSVQNVTRRFPTPLRLFVMSLGLPWRMPRWFAWADTEDLGWDRVKTARDVDWIGGAFLLARGDLVERIGLLDDEFFFYGEDVEFCHRVWRSGHRCHYDPSVSVLHLGGRSTARSGVDDLWRRGQLWSARYLVQRKIRGRLAELCTRAQDALVWSFRAVRRRFQSGAGSAEHLKASVVLRAALSRARPAAPPSSLADSIPRLRVLFALPGLHRVERGAEIAFENLARHLAARTDCQVTLIGSGRGTPRQPYRFLRARSIDRERFRRFPRIPPLRDPFRYEELSFLPALWRRYRPEDFDVTVTCSYPFVNWALRAKRHKRQRPAHVFVTQNGDWAPRRENSEYRRFSCDGLVCTNPEYHERHAQTWRSALIPNGVDLEAFRPGPGAPELFDLPSNTPFVLVVSSLTPNKRVLEAIEAIAPDPDLHLVVAGRGPQKGEMLDRGQRLMGARFHHREVPAERMGDLYRAASVLLHMSRTEPFGNIYPEALATGLPIVADDNERSRWIVEGEARLVDTRDGGAVLDAVRAALADSDPQAPHRRRALAERRFGWPAIADQYLDFMRGIAVESSAGDAPDIRGSVDPPTAQPESVQ